MPTPIHLSCPLFFVWLLLLTAAARSATEYVEGDVLVTFKAEATLETAKGVLKKKSLNFTRHFDRLSAKRKRHTGLVTDRSKTTLQLIAELKDEPLVEVVEPNYVRWLSVDPNDTRFAEMWGLRNTGQTVNGTTGTASADAKFVPARALARTPGGEIVVGVIDSGVDFVHPDLAANIWVNPQETPGNNLDDDTNGFVDDVNGYDFASSDANPSDSGHHGTHVAGTVGAVGDNNAGVIGVNEKVRILPLKVSNDGTTISSSAAIAALQYAVALKNRGVNIVALNASYGGGGNSSTERAAIQAAGDAGIIFCAAAGNEATNNDSTPTYPAGYRLANMIVVAASDQNDALSGFSNFGATTVDLAAPGSNILSTQPATVSFRAGSTTYSSNEMTFGGATTGITGTIVDCGNGNTAGQFPAAVNGNIALIQRGTETFATKVTNAMNAGARAAIIYNNVSGTLAGTLGAPGNWIPARSITQADGLAIRAALPLTGAIVVAGNYQFLNGTSMATPHVSGAVALAAMNFPNDSVAQRRQRIVANVDVKLGLQGKVLTNGRLNLLRMVDVDSNGVGDWQPVITTTTLPPAIHGEAYAQSLVATGGSLPYTWSIAEGALPTGLHLSTAGVISGTTSVNGVANFTARATDSTGAVGTRAFTLTAAPTGPLHHFTWDYGPTTVYAGLPFAVKITARDADERLISTDPTVANSAVNLSATSVNPGGAVVVSPVTVTLSGGAFVGYLTVAQAASGVTITAAQGAVSGTSGSFTANSGASTANDGLPDSWKSAFGLSTTANVAGVDTDGDGLTNAQEFSAGTNPTAPSSALRILSVGLDPGGLFTINFSAVAGKLYRVSESSGLGEWMPLFPPILAPATGPQQVILNRAGAPQLFFRIEIVP